MRWCPICDGYEVMDQSIAILSPAKPGLRHALFLRTYTRRITLLALGDSQGLSQDEVSQMEAAEIEFLTAPVVSFKADAGNKCVVVALADGTERLAGGLASVVARQWRSTGGPARRNR